MRELFRDEVEQVMAEFSLPPLPGYYDGPGYRDLILFTQDGVHALLTQCSREDAMGYCDREDTHGPGWFAGFDVPEDAYDD
jgi:hypothetical protein